MHLQVRHGALWACHDPLQGGPDCTTRIPKPESPAHRHYKDYTARAADNAGYTTRTEYSTGRGTRLDVAINAPHQFGAEIQFSTITARDAKTRTTKSARAGWPPLWLPGSKKVGDTLAGHVPVLRHNDTEIDWTPALPRAGTATALGLRHITREKCTPASRWQACPDTGRGTYCRQWHPWLNDVATGWTLDNAITGVGAGELTTLQTRTGMVLLVIADDMHIYRELTGHDGLFQPGGALRTIPPPDDNQARECTAERPTMLEMLYDTCLICSNPLLLRSPGRDICEHCRIRYGLNTKPIQLAFTFDTA